MPKTRISLNHLIVVVVSTFCLGILVVSAQPQVNQTPASGVTEKKPLVIIKDQPDSPFIISSVIVDDIPDPRMPTIDFIAKNVSGKRVMVYSIKHEAAWGGQVGISGTVTVILSEPKRALRPGKAPRMEIFGTRYPQVPESFTLSVDFVEFVDGTRWGEDTDNNGERLDGIRAGANAQREALMKILKTKGPEELMRLLDSTEPQADQSSSRSAKWLDGFRHGMGVVRARVRRKSQNPGELEKELRQQVNPRENRR